MKFLIKDECKSKTVIDRYVKEKRKISFLKLIINAYYKDAIKFL